jgi:hypothetical protein
VELLFDGSMQMVAGGGETGCGLRQGAPRVMAENGGCQSVDLILKCAQARGGGCFQAELEIVEVLRLAMQVS